MKPKNRAYYKDWFVFPFAIIYHSSCLEFYPPRKRLEFHFLWWHWRWYFPVNDDIYEDDLK